MEHKAWWPRQGSAVDEGAVAAQSLCTSWEGFANTHEVSKHPPFSQGTAGVIDKQRQSVLGAIQQAGMSAKLARSLHDLLLASTVFGYLPPIRLSCIRSLMLLGYDGPCHKPDCINGSSCHGNQLRCNGNAPLHMYLPHHKNEGPWGRAPISFNLPHDLAELMRMHLSEGHKLLTEYLGREDEPHVFVDNKGRPFNDSNLTIYWTRC